MDTQIFRNVLTSFADSPSDVDLSKGTLVIQLREELIQAHVFNKHGSLYVRENDEEFSAAQWIALRVARLPLLADRILGHVSGDPNFVTPSGDLLDQLDENPSEVESLVNDAGATTLEILGRRPAGTASVLYLTSDAGEGKTTLISDISRRQAESYKAKKVDWLIVPVSLGGRTFMRFDDVIVGALVNRLRFNFLYYEAFINLVRMGLIVPAFDGFEEMFIEGSSGEAISALGNLMNTLQSSGSILIAARKAYFEFKSLYSQTKLFDSLGGQSVTFGRLALRRWSRLEFLKYATNRGLSNAREIYDEVSAKLGEGHPLLTRAILVKRLLDVASETEHRAGLLFKIESNPADYFRHFVGTIIAREAREKWIDKIGLPAHPLISEEEHYEILSQIAQEMWLNGSESLRGDIMDFVAEIFSDSKKKDRGITQQIMERLKQHALIVQANGSQFGFDHQEFYHFFLGEAVGRLILRGDKTEIRHCLKQAGLPSLSVESSARLVRGSEESITQFVSVANDICIVEPRASYVKDNLGGILVRILDRHDGTGLEIRRCAFPAESLSGRELSNLAFQDCYFQNTSLNNMSVIRNCRFHNCEFEQLAIQEGAQVNNSFLIDCTCRCVVPPNTEFSVFVPEQISRTLTQIGFTSTMPGPTAIGEGAAPDGRMILIERLIRILMRTTAVNENTLKMRFGTQATEFFDDILPSLVAAGIIMNVPFKGSGTQQRFRLRVPLDRVNHAIEQSGGNFTRFLDAARPVGRTEPALPA